MLLITRRLFLVSMIVLGCHRSQCEDGGLRIIVVQGGTNSDVYDLSFLVHSGVSVSSFAISCSAGVDPFECESAGEPTSEDPLFSVVLITDPSEPHRVLLNIRSIGCDSAGVCDEGPDKVEVGIVKNAVLIESLVLEPVYTTYCTDMFGKYGAATHEIVLE